MSTSGVQLHNFYNRDKKSIFLQRQCLWTDIFPGRMNVLKTPDEIGRWLFTRISTSRFLYKIMTIIIIIIIDNGLKKCTKVSG